MLLLPVPATMMKVPVPVTMVVPVVVNVIGMMLAGAGTGLV